MPTNSIWFRFISIVLMLAMTLGTSTLTFGCHQCGRSSCTSGGWCGSGTCGQSGWSDGRFVGSCFSSSGPWFASGNWATSSCSGCSLCRGSRAWPTPSTCGWTSDFGGSCSSCGVSACNGCSSGSAGCSSGTTTAECGCDSGCGSSGCLAGTVREGCSDCAGNSAVVTESACSSGTCGGTESGIVTGEADWVEGVVVEGWPSTPAVVPSGVIHQEVGGETSSPAVTTAPAPAAAPAPASPPTAEHTAPPAEGQPAAADIAPANTTPAPVPPADASEEGLFGEGETADGADDLFDGQEPATEAAPPEAAEAAPPAAEEAAPAAEQPAATEPPAPQGEEGENQEPLDDLFGGQPAGTILISATTAPFRQWTDNTGYFQTVGRLVAIGRSHVRLLKDNGHHCTVPIHRLSQADARYVLRIATGQQALVRVAGR